jgi:hypothetical protein
MVEHDGPDDIGHRHQDGARAGGIGAMPPEQIDPGLDQTGVEGGILVIGERLVRSNELCKYSL